MNGEIRGRTNESGSVAAEVAAAIAQLQGLGHDDPIVLAYHPVARINPYQALLYQAAWDHGIAPIRLYNLADLDDVVAVADAAGVRPVLHLHWTNGVLARTSGRASGRAALTEFTDKLDRFLANGGSLVWTVHNVFPHDARLRDLEAELQQAIANRCAIVHVLSKNTPAEVAQWFSIPEERTLYVPHPNYIGAYVDTISRPEARWVLALDQDSTVYALLGAIKPYKGVRQLLDAFEILCERDPGRRQLVVAGAASPGPEVDDFLRRCVLHPFISLHEGRIPGDDMQLFLRAADIVVLPYLRSLNSGVLMLALSFGLPVVAPAVGGIAEVVTPDIGRTFIPGDSDSLLAAMVAADELRNPEAREAAMRAAREYDPGRLSADFSRAVVERIRTPRPMALPASRGS